MIDVAKDIHPLTTFKRQTARFARLLKKTHRPLVLTALVFPVFETSDHT